MGCGVAPHPYAYPLCIIYRGPEWYGPGQPVTDLPTALYVISSVFFCSPGCTHQGLEDIASSGDFLSYIAAIDFPRCDFTPLKQVLACLSLRQRIYLMVTGH